METKRILVLCGGKFAFPTLQTLGIEKFLCGIGIGNGEKGVLSVLNQESQSSGLPFRSFPNKESLSDLRNWINEIQPDYIFSISFPFLLSKDVLSYGEDKFINFHPGLLPQYRGPMPIFEVLRYQEKKTAISVHFMNEEFDEGDIILTETLPISLNENYGELALKLSVRTAMVALNMANMLQFASTIPRTKQNENQARYFEKPENSDTFIQWNRMSADEIIALINACNPWNQGANAILTGQNVKLLGATLSSEKHADLAGKILHKTDDGAIAISCIHGEVIHIQIIVGDFGIISAERFFKLHFTPGFIFN